MKARPTNCQRCQCSPHFQSPKPRLSVHLSAEHNGTVVSLRIPERSSTVHRWIQAIIELLVKSNAARRLGLISAWRTTPRTPTGIMHRHLFKPRESSETILLCVAVPRSCPPEHPAGDQAGAGSPASQERRARVEPQSQQRQVAPLSLLLVDSPVTRQDQTLPYFCAEVSATTPQHGRFGCSEDSRSSW